MLLLSQQEFLIVGDYVCEVVVELPVDSIPPESPGDSRTSETLSSVSCATLPEESFMPNHAPVIQTLESSLRDSTLPYCAGFPRLLLLLNASAATMMRPLGLTAPPTVQTSSISARTSVDPGIGR